MGHFPNNLQKLTSYVLDKRDNEQNADLSLKALKRNPSSFVSAASKPPISISIKQKQNWNKSASIANLPANNINDTSNIENETDSFSVQNISMKQNCSPSKVSETSSNNILTGAGNLNSSGFKKNKLSSLKKNRNYAGNIEYYAKIPIDPAMSTISNGRPFSTICVADDSTNDQYSVSSFTQTNKLEHRPSTSNLSSDLHTVNFQTRRHYRITQNAAIDTMNLNALKNANALLELIETLRKEIIRANASGADFSEIVNFEACMLNLEAVLKVI